MGQFYCAWAVSSAYIIMLCACALAVVLCIRGGDGCLYRVQNIACYRMRMGFIGVQVAHSVADDLNIYYEQFPCVGTPKFQSRTKTNESWCFLRGHGRAEGLSLKKFFCTRHKHPSPPLVVHNLCVGRVAIL